MLFGLFGGNKKSEKREKAGKAKPSKAKKRTAKVSPAKKFGFMSIEGNYSSKLYGTVHKVSKIGDVGEEICEVRFGKESKYMKSKTDMVGLKKYLVEKGIMKSKDSLVNISD